MIQLVLYLVISSVDIDFHDSYYIVAHFHYVVSISSINATLFGLLYIYIIRYSIKNDLLILGE